MLKPSDFRFFATTYAGQSEIGFSVHFAVIQGVVGRRTDEVFDLARQMKRGLVARVYDNVVDRLCQLDALICRANLVHQSEYVELRRHVDGTLRLIEALGDLTEADREMIATALAQPGMNTGDGGDLGKPASLPLQGDVGENPTGSGHSFEQP